MKINVQKLGNGSLCQDELLKVLHEGCKENDLHLEEEQLEALNEILWKETVGTESEMTVQNLKDEVYKYPELSKGLCRRYMFNVIFQ